MSKFILRVGGEFFTNRRGVGDGVPQIVQDAFGVLFHEVCRLASGVSSVARASPRCAKNR